MSYYIRNRHLLAQAKLREPWEERWILPEILWSRNPVTDQITITIRATRTNHLDFIVNPIHTFVNVLESQVFEYPTEGLETRLKAIADGWAARVMIPGEGPYEGANSQESYGSLVWIRIIDPNKDPRAIYPYFDVNQ